MNITTDTSNVLHWHDDSYDITKWEFFNSIIILWDHRHICGLLLTELLLSGTWLYIENFKDSTKNILE